MAYKSFNYLWTAIFVAMSTLSSPGLAQPNNDGADIDGGRMDLGGKEIADKTAQAEYKTPEEALKGLGQNLTEQAKAQPVEVVGVSDDVAQLREALAQKSGSFVLVNDKGSGKNTLMEYMAGILADGREIWRLDIGPLMSNTSYHKQLETKLNLFLKAFEQANGQKILYIESAESIAKDDSIARALERVSSKFLIFSSTTQDGFNELKKFNVFSENIIYTKKVDVAHITDILFQKLPEIERETGMKFTPESVEKTAELVMRYMGGRPSLIALAIKVLKVTAAREKTEKANGSYEFDRLQDQRASLERKIRMLERNAVQFANSPLEEDIKRVEETEEKLREVQLEKKILEDKLKEVMEKTLDGAKKVLDAWKAELERAKKSGDLALATEIQNQKIPGAERRVRYFETDTVRRFDMIDMNHVIRTVSVMTKIPPEVLGSSPKQLIDKLALELRTVIHGQGNGVETIISAFKNAMSGLEVNTKPLSALLAGSTGVGKTFIVKTIARILLGSEMSMAYFNFEQFDSKESVTQLFGALPGYSGFTEEGGRLIEHVRKNPYTIVLIDEVEKGHAAVFQALMGVLDNGYMYDHKGRFIDFRNVIFMITTNAASEYALYRDVWDNERVAQEYKIDVRELDGLSKDEIAEKIVTKELKSKGWTDAVINRLMMMVVFNPINVETAVKIAKSLLDRQVKDAYEQKRIRLSYTPAVVESLVKAGYDNRLGARPYDRVRRKTIFNLLAELVIEHDPARGSEMKVDFIKSEDGSGGKLEAKLITSKGEQTVAMDILFKSAMTPAGQAAAAKKAAEAMEIKESGGRIAVPVEFKGR